MDQSRQPHVFVSKSGVGPHSGGCLKFPTDRRSGRPARRAGRFPFVLSCLLAGLLSCTAALAGDAVRKADAEAAGAPAEAIEAWRDARFGMFIHWGPVSLTGKEIGWARGREIPIEEYDALHKRFDPVDFDADAWVATAKAAGMRYVVLTTKHHDGFCLWPTERNEFNVARTPFGRDVTGELAAACRRAGLGFGTYYSTCDWWHPDFPLGGPAGRVRRAESDLEAYTGYLKAQSAELLRNYGPLFTLWYDVPQEFDAARGQSVIDFIREIQPDIVVNNRTGAPGDYDTPEQRIGGFQMERPWETCMTIGRQWAWKPDEELKSPAECVHTLLRVIGGDGNFLFNVGPRPDGVIDPPQVEILEKTGAWVRAHGEAVFGTRGGPWKPSGEIASTRKGKHVFIHVLNGNPGEVRLRALPATPVSARLLSGAEVAFETDGEEWLFRPPAPADPIATVIVLEIEEDALSLEPVGVRPALLDSGAKLTASTVFSDAYPAEHAGDGDPSTRWATPAGTEEAWLEVDFGKERKLAGVEIDEFFDRGWASALPGTRSRVASFVISVPDGKGGWKPVFEGADIGPGRRCLFDAVLATPRFRIQLSRANEGPTISEIRLIQGS